MELLKGISTSSTCPCSMGRINFSDIFEILDLVKAIRILTISALRSQFWRVWSGYRTLLNENNWRSLVLLESNSCVISRTGAGLPEGVSMGSQVMVQIIGVITTVIWCGFFTYVILKVVDRLNGLRLSEEDEETGIDLTQHGEAGYND